MMVYMENKVFLFCMLINDFYAYQIPLKIITNKIVQWSCQRLCFRVITLDYMQDKMCHLYL